MSPGLGRWGPARPSPEPAIVLGSRSSRLPACEPSYLGMLIKAMGGTTPVTPGRRAAQLQATRSAIRLSPRRCTDAAFTIAVSAVHPVLGWAQNILGSARLYFARAPGWVRVIVNVLVCSRGSCRVGCGVPVEDADSTATTGQTLQRDPRTPGTRGR